MQEPISEEMYVAEVLERVPNARAIFQRHGIDPIISCGLTTRFLRLDETPAHCELEDLEGLLVELNDALNMAQTEQADLRQNESN